MASKQGPVRLARPAEIPSPADFERVFDCAGAAISTISTDGRFRHVNPAFAELTGYTPDELVRFQDITHPDDLQADLDAMAALIAGEAERYSHDKRYIRKNGRELWVRMTTSLVRDGRGAPDYFIKVAQNIDAERSAERGLAAREAQLRTMIETVPVGVVVAEYPSGRIVAGNSWVEQLLRHPVRYSKSIQSYGEWVAFHADGRRVRGEEYPIARIFLGGEEAPSLDVNYRRGDGTFAWLRCVARPIRNPAGEITGGVVALVDIDDERRAREQAASQLESVRAQLIHASRVSAMGTMASTIAHEINQPLAALATCLGGTVKRLRKDGAGAVGEAIEWLERGSAIAHQAGETIHRLRAMLVRGESRTERVPLIRLIDDARAIALAGGEAARVDYRQKVCPDLHVTADPIQIQQVLINLMRNAVEAVPAGVKPRLSVAARRVEDKIEISVRDNGTGIPRDLMPNLFDPFMSTKTDGMGIGLPISRTIVEAHGGRIRAGAARGGGSVLSFTIPAG